MSDKIEKAKANFTRVKERMSHLLELTPEDKLNWSPSPSARTPLQIVAHSAEAIKNIHGFLEGHPFDIENTARADQFFREWEKQFTSRQQVVELFERNSSAYLSFLDSLSQER